MKFTTNVCLGLILAGSVCGPAFAEGVKVDIRGNISSVQNANPNNQGVFGTVLIEGKIEKDTGFDKARVRITRSTKLLERKDGREVAIKFEDLKVGQRVEAAFDGPVAESYPVQTNAGRIVVLR